MTKEILWPCMLIVFPILGVAHSLDNKSCLDFNYIINSNIRKLNVPAASFSTILPNKKQISCAQGLSDLSNRKKITTNNEFQIGSVTKTFIATLVLLAVENHKLTLDETISQTVKDYGHWLPQKALKEWGNVTIKQLLNMTSGIYSYTESSSFNKSWKKHPKREWTALEIINIALSNQPYFKPGRGWHYSDTNYYLIGLLLEKMNHELLTKQINQKLLNPFHISHITYIPNKYNSSITAKLAKGYGKNLIDRTEVNMSQAGAAGAIIARPSSLAKWLHDLFSGKILSHNMLKQMLTPYSKKTGQVTRDPKTNAYGLGVFRSYYPNRGGINWGYLGGR